MRRNVREYLAHLEREGYAASTIGARRRLLAGRFKPSPAPHLARQQLSQWRHFLRFIGRDDPIALPRTPKPPPKRPPSIEEVKALLLRFDGRTPGSLRDRAVVELLYSSGLRGCEVERLRLEDVDLEMRVVRVHGKGGRERTAPIGRAACGWLGRYLVEGRPRLAPRGGSLFVNGLGRPMRIWTMRRRLQPLAPHDLRRAAAAHCQARGMNLREIQELLGHADCRNTARYTAFDRSELRAVLGRCHPRARICPEGSP